MQSTFPRWLPRTGLPVLMGSAYLWNTLVLNFRLSQCWLWGGGNNWTGLSLLFWEGLAQNWTQRTTKATEEALLATKDTKTLAAVLWNYPAVATCSPRRCSQGTAPEDPATVDCGTMGLAGESCWSPKSSPDHGVLPSTFPLCVVALLTKEL